MGVELASALPHAPSQHHTRGLRRSVRVPAPAHYELKSAHPPAHTGTRAHSLAGPGVRGVRGSVAVAPAVPPYVLVLGQESEGEGEGVDDSSRSMNGSSRWLKRL